MSNKAAEKNMKQKRKRELMPRLRFPEFLDAGGWEEKKLGKMLSESRVLGSRGDVAQKLTVKLWGKGVVKKEETISGSVNTQYYRRQSGQFIYSKLDFLNQAFGIIPSDLDGCESTIDLPCFDLNNKKINPIFLLEYVKRKAFYKIFGEIADGGRKAKRIQVGIFLSFPISLPPYIQEQKKIANCLSSIDHAITEHTQKLDTLKAHKKGLMQQLFPAEGEKLPRLRFPEFLAPWTTAPLRELADIINEKAGENKYTLMSISAGIGLVSQIEKFGREIAGAQYKNYYVIHKNDFAYNKSATKEYPEGFIAIYKSIEPGAVPNSIFTCFRPQVTKISPYFLGYLFLGNLHGKWLSKYITVGARAHGSLNIDNKDLFSIPVPFPAGTQSLNEQKKIADCLSSLDTLITAQVQKVEALKSHKKGLMQQLFPALEEEKA